MLHPLGFIHGRFQVLHNDHLAYLLAGKNLCDRLIVGITNPDSASICDEATAPERSSRENNPLTYEERKAMIEAALSDAGVDPSEFSVAPFPISRPELFENHTPRDAVYYLTIYDDWGREKKKRLEAHGLRTHVMWERPLKYKGISGKDVRAAIRDNGDWHHLVPPGVAKLVEQWNLQDRFNMEKPFKTSSPHQLKQTF